MTRTIRWGVLGCGKIARKFAADLRLVKEARLTAVASKDETRGKEFAETFGASLVFTNYEDLVSTIDVDVIYVATPHGLHYEHVMLCLHHRKAVLCEKAFALNTQQATEMIALARKNNVFLMEAFWTKFLPQYKKVIELLNTNAIGEVRWLQADFGFKAASPTPQRLYDPLLGGGSLLDVGIYPVFFATSLLGKPVDIKVTVTRYPSGTDEQCAIIMTFPGDVMAVLSCSFAVDTPVEATIAGTEGRLHLRNRFHNAISNLEIIRGKDFPPEPVEVYREDGFGYQFEAQHVTDCLLKGLAESPVMTHDDTLALMQTLDEIRRIAGVQYPVDR
jgi:predicted dehydrogenase